MNRSPRSLEAAAIGQRLRELRVERGRRLGEVAAEVGLTPAQLCNTENGKHEPRWAIVNRIYAALGVRLREEVTDREPKNRAA